MLEGTVTLMVIVKADTFHVVRALIVRYAIGAARLPNDDMPRVAI